MVEINHVDACTCGDAFPHLANTLQNRHMKLFLLELFASSPGKEYGRAGYLASGNSSCGRRHTKNVLELMIALQEKDFPTLQFALFVIRLKKL